jgi:hypothetical protein
MNRSMQEETSFSRERRVSAASEKYFDHVQPPSETTTWRPGWSAFSAFSCWKLPRIGRGHVTSVPSTDSSAVQGFW